MTSPAVAEKRAPSKSQRNCDSNTLRESVFNVFLELGGMDQHSGIADLMFNEEASDSVAGDAPSRRPQGRGNIHFQETNSGSRFREFFDSDTEEDASYEQYPPVPLVRRRSRSSRPASRTSKFFDRVRSKSRSRRGTDQESRSQYAEDILSPPSSAPPTRKKSFFEKRPRTAVTIDDAPPTPSSPKRRPFTTLFQSKSSTNLRKDQVEVPISRSSSQETITPTQSSFPDTITDPVGVDPAQVPIPSSRPASTINDEDWERISMSFPPSPKYNPFLHGDTDSSNSPAKDGSLFHKFSLRELVQRETPKKEPLRRVQSNFHSDFPPLAKPPFLRSVSARGAVISSNTT